MVEVLVEYDYTAKEPDELSIKKGDVIKDVVRKVGGWWEGVLHDRKGMFPDNFVKLVDKDPAVTLRSRKDSSRIRQCRVVFSYKQDHPDELNLNVGDVVDILGEEEEGWWRGLLNGREGVFPSNFVEEIKSKPGSREDLTNVHENDLKSPLLPPKPAKILCQVKFSYKAQNDDELSMKEGDIITLISKDGQDVGWWRGELNGRLGVFPDNFVVVLSDPDDKTPKEDRRKCSEPQKTATSAQRKSLEERRHAEERKLEERKPEERPEKETDSVRVTPPVPSKKPIIPIKKSPSGSAAQVGLLAGLRKKIVDVVDGASNSKSSQPVLVKASEIKDEGKEDALPVNAFDQVERTAILSDVRATRAKAPGRRPPSVVFKEGEPGVVNGNTEHAPVDEQISSRSSSSSNDPDEVKPRVREWEKHKAPWLEEMKLNQAKRTSTSPGPEPNKLKLTPSEKTCSPEVEESKSQKTSPFERERVPEKTPPPLSNKLKTPPNELEKPPVISWNKQQAATPATRPQTINNALGIGDSTPPKFAQATKTSPAQTKTSPSPKPLVMEKTVDLKPVDPRPNADVKPNVDLKPNVDHKPAVDHKGSGDVVQDVTNRQYLELLQRIEKLEVLIEQQHQMHKAAIEELKGKLQLETDMRRLLQAELDKVVSQCVMQV